MKFRNQYKPVTISPTALTYNEKKNLGSNTLSVEEQLKKFQEFYKSKNYYGKRRPDYINPDLGSDLDQAHSLLAGTHPYYRQMSSKEAITRIAEQMAESEDFFEGYKRPNGV